MEMLSVAEAKAIVMAQRPNWGLETLGLDIAAGRVLCEDLYADRDFPPFDRVSMDGIALCFAAFSQGRRSFVIEGHQAAGQAARSLGDPAACIEVMTGALLPLGTDTVIRYEDLKIQGFIAHCSEIPVKIGQNIHFQASDRHQGDLLVAAGSRLGAAEIGIAAAIGKGELLVSALPRVALVSTGDELVAVEEQPLAHQIRRSNVHSVAALLRAHCGIEASLFHFPDDETLLKTGLEQLLGNFEVLICSGAVSEGRYDYLPKVLDQLGVEKCFHKVAQRPGKPFWFGQKNPKSVFALPGNPVSTYLCARYYVVPFLQGQGDRPCFAALGEDVRFLPKLSYFLPVSLTINADAQWVATPHAGHGSGDLANLHGVDAFMELPPDRDFFAKGEVFRVWPV
jgi:molybdopterin molybdotransferase